VAHGFVAASEAPDAGVGSETVDDKGMRLNRWLAEQGVDSRRKCDARIQDGEVTINGSLCMEPGYRVQPGDDIMVNGARVKQTRRLYYLFHKPRGVLCTNDPRETRPRVCDLVDPMVPGRVFPVGRLDEDSEGLLLLTNDGEFANLVAHPRHGVAKTYLCQVPGAVDGETVAALRDGAWIDGGKVVPEHVKVARRTPAGTNLEVTIREGRNREVRRMLARHGLGVKRLKRVRIGTLGMRGLKRGALRPLSREERDALVALARAPKEDAPKGGGGRRGRGR
jgi:23S rRNA pseudouridine2605 synthase